jgi:hypothetical protein
MRFLEYGQRESYRLAASGSLRSAHVGLLTRFLAVIGEEVYLHWQRLWGWATVWGQRALGR